MSQVTTDTIEPSQWVLDSVAWRKPIVWHRFRLNDAARETVRSTPYAFGFDGFGEAVYYRTYSRNTNDGQETWPDTILRVVDGVFTIRKDYYQKNCLPWDEAYWQSVATEFAVYMVQMKFLPPGRGLWAMGTDYIYNRGSMALFNCAATEINDLVADFGWLMDALMCGCGVGFECVPSDIVLKRPVGKIGYTVEDSREGWVESTELLLRSYVNGSEEIEFDYSKIRPAGKKLYGIGGVSAGAEPLIKLHKRLRETCEAFIEGKFGVTRLKADIGNHIGCCVVVGNVRRSALLIVGESGDEEFLNLKNYTLNPDRADFGWMSNNSVRLESDADFEQLPMIAARIRDNGEPGIINQQAMSKFARFGREQQDKARLMNPCAEIPLESKELCNLAEVFPTKCNSEEEFYKACEFASLYCSTVTLLPTHRPETNRIIARNRRIGVSISGVMDWMARERSVANMTRIMRKGYKIVKETNARLATEAGIPSSIRVTTIKPSGTISQLVGCSSGAHSPTFDYATRRMRVAAGSTIERILRDAGYHCEPDTYSENTTVVSFPINQGATRTATQVSIWEQALVLCTLQREWSDNAVSVTLYFDPETESDEIEHVLAQVAPMVKSLSVLPHTKEGVYAQSPYSSLSKEEYEQQRDALRTVDWSTYRGDGEDDKYCNGDKCELPKRR